MMLQSVAEGFGSSAADLVDSAAELVESAFCFVSSYPPAPSTSGQHIDYMLENLAVFFSTLIDNPNLVPALATTFFLTTAAFFLIVPLSSLKRHVSWLIDTLWAGPCIVVPDLMDKWYTEKFIKEFEEDALRNSDESKKTIGIILVMGAQNAGCHLVYWKLMRKMKQRLEVSRAGVTLTTILKGTIR